MKLKHISVCRSFLGGFTIVVPFTHSIHTRFKKKSGASRFQLLFTKICLGYGNLQKTTHVLKSNHKRMLEGGGVVGNCSVVLKRLLQSQKLGVGSALSHHLADVHNRRYVCCKNCGRNHENLYTML